MLSSAHLITIDQTVDCCTELFGGGALQERLVRTRRAHTGALRWLLNQDQVARLWVDKLDLPDLIPGFDRLRVYSQHHQIRGALEIEREQGRDRSGAGDQKHTWYRLNDDSQAFLQPLRCDNGNRGMFTCAGWRWEIRSFCQQLVIFHSECWKSALLQS